MKQKPQAKYMDTLKKAFLAFSLTASLILPHAALAATSDLPCVPSQAPAKVEGQNTATPNNDLFDCINRLYKYALVISSIAGVFMIMLGGYMYIFSGGNDKKVSTAKSFITTSLLGIAVLLTGFLLLKQINPSLLQIKSITPTQIAQSEWAILPHDGGGGGGGTGPGGGGGGTNVGTGKCEPVTSGPASVANLQGTCFGSNAAKASSIANLESSGNPSRHGDKCVDGSYASWGLFQINISANTMAGLNCPKAFDVAAKGSTLLSGGVYNCHVINRPLYDQCVAAATNESTNIEAACRISNNGTRWSAWSTNKTCKF